jgi:hypothetical protein
MGYDGEDEITDFSDPHMDAWVYGLGDADDVDFENDGEEQDEDNFHWRELVESDRHIQPFTGEDEYEQEEDQETAAQQMMDAGDTGDFGDYGDFVDDDEEALEDTEPRRRSSRLASRSHSRISSTSDALSDYSSSDEGERENEAGSGTASPSGDHNLRHPLHRSWTHTKLDGSRDKRLRRASPYRRMRVLRDDD